MVRRLQRRTSPAESLHRQTDTQRSQRQKHRIGPAIDADGVTDADIGRQFFLKLADFRSKNVGPDLRILSRRGSAPFDRLVFKAQIGDRNSLLAEAGEVMSATF